MSVSPCELRLQPDLAQRAPGFGPRAKFADLPTGHEILLARCRRALSSAAGRPSPVISTSSSHGLSMKRLIHA